MTGLDPDLRALQEVRDLVGRAERAKSAAMSLDQARTDAACKAMVQAASGAAHELASLAVEETGIGRVHDKVLKNLFASELVWGAIAEEKTVGIVSRDADRGVIEIATPAGVVAAIVPTTNPTSTTIHNALISVKGRNAVVVSPHPRAKRSVAETVRVLRKALERAGAPPDLVLSLSDPTLESTAALMQHDETALILATGGSGLVTAAYSSGKPAFGVGPGNVPVYVDRSADVEQAARWLVASQSFDNATLCCSEQALVLDRPIADRLLAELKRRGAHLCCEEQTRKLEELCNVGGHMNPDIVGQDPARVAAMAGFELPCSTTLLLAHQAGVGREHPLSIEILCPLLSVHVVDGWQEGCELSMATLHYGGLGHTLGLWAKDEEVQSAWYLQKPANRIIVNGPTSQGAIGYSTALEPSVSLGCGPQAGNITSDNISARHLVNLKRVAFARSDWEAMHQRDHERAAKLSGERDLRGTGLAGDPGLVQGEKGGARVEPSVVTTSNWQGNPPVFLREEAPRAEQAAPKVAPSQPATTSVRPKPAAGGTAPRFTAPAATQAQSAPGSGCSAPKAACASDACAGPYVGMALTPAEIQGILAHVSSGHPPAPADSCTQRDPRSGG